MKKRVKRGLSAVISTLIIILLSLTAIVILWVVISNIISQGSEDVDIGQFTLNLKVKQVKVQEDGVHISVKRNVGQGNLKEIKFFLSDGKNIQEFEQEANIEELGEQTFILDYNQLLTNVAIAPKTIAGQQRVIDEFNVPGSETVKTIPNLVSYWKFEGNANDDWGDNHGTVTGASLVDGKFGKAYEFDADGEMIEVPDTSLLRLENMNMSILLWVYIKTDDMWPILAKGPAFSPGGGYMVWYPPNSGKFMQAYTVGGQTVSTAPKIYDLNKWTHTALTQHTLNPTMFPTKFYVNGILETELNNNINPPMDSSGHNLTIGYYYEWLFSANSIIDELMIFNRTLTDEEIEFIYNLDLS